ncbi:hypothetical protein L9F63_021575, partial [Diploptera punctata]
DVLPNSISYMNFSTISIKVDIWQRDSENISLLISALLLIFNFSSLYVCKLRYR